MYKAKTGEDEFEIVTGDQASVNGVKKSVQFKKESSTAYVVSIDGKTHTADLVKLDKENKQVIVRIGGKKFTTQLKEPVDQLLDSLGINIRATKKINNLKAPMPGLIIKILAQKGTHYKAGEPLLILEAMKMENVFKAAADVTVKEILIEERQTVEKGQILLVFE